MVAFIEYYWDAYGVELFRKGLPIATLIGLAYVTFVIDAFARRIGEWQTIRTPHASFVLDPSEKTVNERQQVHRSGLIHHSGRGIQCVSIKYYERSGRSRNRTLGRKRRQQL